MEKDIARSEARWKTPTEIPARHGEAELLKRWWKWREKKWKRF